MCRCLKITAIAAAVALLVAWAWRKNKLNSVLPDKLKHKDGFIGLTRSQQYFMGPGGRPGVPGMDVNTSDHV